MKLNGLTISVVLLAALGGAVYWSEKNKDAEDKKPSKDAPPKIISVPTEEIQEIQIQRIGKPMTTLRKAGGQWTMVEPNTWPLDEDSVNSVVTTLSSLESDRLVEEKPANLSEFGLTNPYLQVNLKKTDGKEIRLSIGDDVPTGGNAFAKTRDSERVYTVAGFVKTSLDKTAFDLRNKRLMMFDPDKITRVRIDAGKQSYEFGKNARSEWQIIQPRPMRADGSQVDELVRKLTEAKMGTSVSPDEEAAAQKNFASGKPVAVATVTDAKGDHRLEVRMSGDLVYAKGSAAEAAYKMEGDLNTIGKDLAEYRNKKLFEFGFDDPARIEVDGKAFEKKDTSWVSGGKTMDNESVQAVIDKLRALQAYRLMDTLPASLGEPVLRVTVTSNEGKRVEKVASYPLKDEFLLVREGDNTGYVLDQGNFNELKTKATGIQEAKAATKDEKKK